MAVDAAEETPEHMRRFLEVLEAASASGRVLRAFSHEELAVMRADLEEPTDCDEPWGFLARTTVDAVTHRSER